MPRGGHRPNSGRKNKDYVPMEVLLPKTHKEALKAIYGRKFNQVFRDWVETIIQ